MKKSTTGLLIGSALVVGLSGCASSASQQSGAQSASADRDWYQHPFVCGLAGSVIGGSIGYATSGNSDEDENSLVGATAGAAIGGLLCADRTVKAEPQ
ncbi:MAG: OmpA family protein, partial [Pseudomonadota bacterium]